MSATPPGMTDEEASKEMCPFIRFCVNEVDVIQDGRAPIYMHQSCQGSACRMAWRWCESAFETVARFTDIGAPDGDGWENAGPGPLMPKVIDVDATTFEQTILWRRTRSNRRGYCGIAGKPETT